MVQLASHSTFFSSSARMRSSPAVGCGFSVIGADSAVGPGSLSTYAEPGPKASVETTCCGRYGASSTWRHAAGRSAILGPGLGFAGTGEGLGCSTASENQ